MSKRNVGTGCKAGRDRRDLRRSGRCVEAEQDYVLALVLDDQEALNNLAEVRAEGGRHDSHWKRSRNCGSCGPIIRSSTSVSAG